VQSAYLGYVAVDRLAVYNMLDTLSGVFNGSLPHLGEVVGDIQMGFSVEVSMLNEVER
jgi:hypothetical protein